MKKTSRLMSVIVCCLSVMMPSVAQTNEAEGKQVIATKVAPPFVIKNDDGSFEGISISLWKQIAELTGTDYEFTEASLVELVDGVKEGRFDASVAALTVNAQRETVIDFTHPFYTTGLAIAVPSEGNRWMSAVKGFFSWEFLLALSALCGLLLAVGALLWVFERKHNADMFGGSTQKGLGASFWWAAVTMTTVGYGDKAPVTLGGRVIGFIWMFAAIIIISSFTAAIATSLTVSQLSSSVKGVEDLPDVRVATLSGSASSAFLQRENIGFKRLESVEEGLSQLESGKVDAFVYDKPILQYLTKGKYEDSILILPEVIERQDYAIALPENSAQREKINTALLKVIETDEWQDILDDYLGQ
ncbi:transporter substrate-binding domain-containing protein [Alteromonas sp. 1_MG-2023]|uniref:transporter substrate-binding domain-containing protein n=1 Tax=Alteromonas sp. 1_MG-2023 TaxID=3062669 RepID=UPI0026E3C4E7|nr:transporter substrate-binding domain-containing protein [Alteromonas sp. 1_MG-2023]MDO6565429.1 transporter substrate-binding domain-containing protein [Alteromonas sp. 1_MG-2023]